MDTNLNIDRLEIAKDWLPRYTGMPIDKFGDNILLTNFDYYVTHFADRFDCDIYGEGRPMQAATNSSGLSIINFGIGSAKGTSGDYLPPEVPALPSFKLHKFVSECLVNRDLEYRTGVIYTTNRRLWEHDLEFRKRLEKLTCIGIDMETATLFIVGHYNSISRGALLLVSDVPTTPEGVKTRASDREVTNTWVDQHIEIGIEAMTDISTRGEQIRHFRY